MSLTFHEAQHQVDTWVNQHPDGYRSDEKIFEKMKEEGKEIEEALNMYNESSTEENAQAFKTEIGDELFAIICLANKHNIDLAECFALMIKKNQERAKKNYQK